MQDQQTSFPWPPASATAIGSYPGNDPAEALRVVLGELPDLPHLPELPARGPGADLVGRAAAVLVDLPVEVQPFGWRVAERPGRDLRRARSMLARDLDALEELAAGYDGAFKVQLAGPWTLAGAVELPREEKVLADPGAVRDLISSFAEGLAAHLAEVRRRVPGARLLLQLDEPGLPGVLAGAVPTASGLSRLRAVEEPVAEEGIRAVLTAACAGGDVFPVVHCCARDVPYRLLRRAGARAISVDVRLVGRRDEEPIGEAVEAGLGLFLGVVPGVDAELSSAATIVDPVRSLWHRLGFAPERLSQAVVVTPACGLAGASPAYVRAALARCREAAHVLRDRPEG